MKINPVAMKNKLRSLKLKYRALKKRASEMSKVLEQSKENNPNPSGKQSSLSTTSSKVS